MREAEGRWYLKNKNPTELPEGIPTLQKTNIPPRT
jgi:hypothetical protein